MFIKKHKIFLEGGLGNQLFQIAAFCAFLNQINSSGVVSVGKLDLSNPKRSFSLPEMLLKNLKRNYGISVSRNRLPRIFRKIFYKLENHLICRIFDNCYFSSSVGFNEELFELTSNQRIIHGYFQSYRYPEMTNFKKFFHTNELEVSSNFYSVKDSIINGESIFVHIRGGDYLKDTSGIGNLDSRYFKEALSLINAKYRIYVFTDDPKYVRDNMLLSNFEYQFIDENHELNPFETMLLFSTGSHLIISNSTFAWWGAYFSEHAIVYAPNKWFEYLEDPLDLIPPNWITVESHWK